MTMTARQRAAYRSLMAAVISRALDDLRGNAILSRITEKAKDEAMAFFYSPDCEAYALELGIDPQELIDQAAGLYRELIQGQERGALFYNEITMKGRPSRSCPGPAALRVS
jgi:hypothetical protein